MRLLPHNTPAEVKQTPRGSVVVLGAIVLTDEMKTEDALALDINKQRYVQHWENLPQWT